MQTTPESAAPVSIPLPEAVRARLAVVLTEAAVLRRQLKVSERAAREAERLRRQFATAGGATMPHEPPRTPSPASSREAANV
ncbi:MAG TPA: hypothetical protein VFW33_02655 [Gemmataceae bacterium]|nr:hypothetical protein [Gemmataceae bacterium]